MKIRIKGNSIRLRLTKAEVEHFSRQHFVSSTTRFSPFESDFFTYTLSASDDTTRIAATLSEREIRIVMPKTMASQWAHTDKISLEEHQAVGDEAHLRILIEKDFQCMKARPGEDESDLYPNPNEVG